ncbi:MAG: ribose 5-phosphate isomerase B [Ignavibacteria bacterium]|nr:ribose 5-phosphate isomerase B [Ignavibacteria bacterium]
MKIAIGSDHAGFKLKERVKSFLFSLSHEVIDCGSFSEDSCDYPDYGESVALAIKEEQAKFGIIICGTGIGISITANKIPGIRAALCTSIQMAELARKHNDANILALGARIIDENTANKIVNTFLITDFEGERHSGRINKIKVIEEKYRC